MVNKIGARRGDNTLNTYDSTEKSHQASFSPQYMGVVAEQPPPYIAAEALIW